MKFTKAYVTSGWSKVEGGPASDLIMICPQRGRGVMDERGEERGGDTSHTPLTNGNTGGGTRSGKQEGEDSVTTTCTLRSCGVNMYTVFTHTSPMSGDTLSLSGSSLPNSSSDHVSLLNHPSHRCLVSHPLQLLGKESPLHQLVFTAPVRRHNCNSSPCQNVQHQGKGEGEKQAARVCELSDITCVYLTPLNHHHLPPPPLHFARNSSLNKGKALSGRRHPKHWG